MNFVLVRIVQIVLLVAGTTALGTILGFVGIASFLSLFQSQQGEPWTRGFGQYIGGLVCGAPFGAIAGLVLGVTIARAQDGRENWSWMTWLGVGLGAATGSGIAVSWMPTREYGIWAMLILALACGTLGGLAGGYAKAALKPKRKRK